MLARSPSVEVDTSDPEWIERHKAWLQTDQGRAYLADQSRPVERDAPAGRGHTTRISICIDRTESRLGHGI